MSKFFVSVLVVFAATTMATSLQADPPSHQDFRSQTFTRPSHAMRAFLYSSYGSNHHNRSNFVVVSVGGGSYGYQPSSYYDSVIRNYNASPFDGLNASRSLYSNPYRSSVYGYTTPVQPASFYENTTPYGSYEYRAGGY